MYQQIYPSADDELTRRYQVAYIVHEKCKKMKAIEMANAESRHLQREIHCMLDTLAELIPLEDLLDDSNWSDSEAQEDDDEPKDRFFLEYEEEEEQEEPDSEAEELAKLQAEYDDLVKANERSKRYAGSSPTKAATGAHSSSGGFGGPTKIRRTFKHLPVNEAGEIEFPVVLGRGPNRISISKIGLVRIVDGHHLPTNYECRRKYHDRSQSEEQFNSESRKQTYYICSLTEEEDKGFKYRIGTADGDLNIEENSIQAAWDQFRAAFPAYMRPQLDDDFPDPRAFFGLEHDNLVKYFKEKSSAH